MDDITLSSFPRNDIEALAMLYVKSQDLTGITIEALVTMYDNAYKTISEIRVAQPCADDRNEEWL